MGYFRCLDSDENRLFMSMLLLNFVYLVRASPNIRLIGSYNADERRVSRGSQRILFTIVCHYKFLSRHIL